jgi:hypothetical protein
MAKSNRYILRYTKNLKPRNKNSKSLCIDNAVKIYEFSFAYKNPKHLLKLQNYSRVSKTRHCCIVNKPKTDEDEKIR